jgi:RTX calcium-binding nonapeptide repeat (4 copies)
VHRLALPALVAALLAPSAAWGKNLVGTSGADRLVGTAGGDLIQPNGGADYVDARGGNDRIVAPLDDAADAINCGGGRDLVLVDLLDAVASDCETVARQLSRDATPEFRAQHETEVEPDSFAFGRTVVAAFQVGRFGGGGAAALGWATSHDAGASWRSGELDTLFPAVSDPVVGYDAVHATWLIAFLGLTGRSVDVFVSRSSDGIAWGAPVPVAPADVGDYDKEWIVCDNGAASAFRGRCYVSYLDLTTGSIVTRASTDGGVTWGGAVGSRAGIAPGELVNGAAPVVRPNGTLLVLFTVFAAFGDLSGDRVAVVRSTDGGATVSPAVRVAELDGEDVLGLRAPPLVSADVDPTGAVHAVWSDCRFREQCDAADIVIATSRDGVAWSPPARVPAVAQASRVDAFVPAVASSGTRIAVAYYSQPQPNGCAVDSCPGVLAWLITATGGRWGTPQRLSPQAMPLEWLADGGLGAMVGDYVSVSWAGGRALPVMALATAPESESLREAIFAISST